MEDYVSQFSDGRGVILVGQSQGSTMLTRLLAEEVDRWPALREQLVSAHLLRSSVLVPEGERVGGSFAEIPGCAAADETGCVVSWASYRADSSPPDNAFFGRTAFYGSRSLCTDVVALLGRDHGTALERTAAKRTTASGEALPELDGVETPYVSWPDAVDVSCVAEGKFDYLAVALTDPDDDRPLGTLQYESLGPNWGLHLVNMKVVLGDLVELATRQGSAYVD